jgi:hypothetical protein
MIRVGNMLIVRIVGYIEVELDYIKIEVESSCHRFGNCHRSGKGLVQKMHELEEEGLDIHLLAIRRQGKGLAKHISRARRVEVGQLEDLLPSPLAFRFSEGRADPGLLVPDIAL